MKKIYSLTFSCVIIFLTITHTPVKAAIDPALDSTLQHCLDSVRAYYQMKGVSAAAYIPGQGMWQGVSGVSHATVPIDTDMVFSIGSITKTFIAAEIFKLIETGVLTLDDTLGSLLPPMNFVRGDIKIRNLLGHRSGLAEYLGIDWQNSMFADPYRIWSGEEALDSFLTAATGVPGGPYNYRNTNYVLLGMVIESLEGDSLHHVLRNNFFTSLNMNDTYMYVHEQLPNPIPHMWNAPNFDPNQATDSWSIPRISASSSTSAAGGLYATAADLAWWGYNLYSGNVISPASLSDMLSFVTVSSSYYNGYGLGCMRFPYMGRTYWGHAGNFWGYASCMMYYPQDQICVTTLINIDCYGSNAARPLMNELVNQLINTVESYQNNNSIDVYPNPANSRFTIGSSKFPVEAIEIFNSIGEKMTANIISTDTNKMIVDVEDFNPGIYFVKAISKNGIVVRKLIVD
jgi:D-alanyl-D-alanine carboxypeptidase